MTDTEQVLRKVLDEFAAERNYEQYDAVIKEASTDGANFTAMLYQVTLTPFQQEPIRLFAKVAVASESMRKETGGRMYEIERCFYQDLQPKFEQIQEKHHVRSEHRFASPKFYGFRELSGREVLLLEDLTASEFVSLHRTQVYSWEYASRSVEQLARFHALSFALQHESPAEFEELKETFPFPMEHLKGIELVFSKIIKDSPLIVKDELKGKLKAFVEGLDLASQWAVSCQPHKQCVVVHGDYRVSNLLHRSKDGEMDIVPVDYQMMFVGCPLSDLLYLIYAGSDKEFRRLHYKALMEHYYAELAVMLQRLHLDINHIYPREDFEDDQARLKMHGLSIALTTLVVVCIDADSAPELGADIADFSFVPSQLYIERLNDIVAEYVENRIL